MAVSEPYQLETASTSHFLRKVSWIVVKSFLSVSTFAWKDLVHLLAGRFQTPLYKLNNLNVNCCILKLLKGIGGRTKCPGGLHEAGGPRSLD